MSFFSLNPTEIIEIQNLINQKYYYGEAIVIKAITSPEKIKDLLPSIFELSDSISIDISLGSFATNCIGNFSYCGFSIPCKYKGIDGSYQFAMYLDSDVSVMSGRDFYGEPKKLAKVSLLKNSDGYHGIVVRNEVDIVDLKFKNIEEIKCSSQVTKHNQFTVRILPKPEGFGLEPIAQVIQLQRHMHTDLCYRGEGNIVLKSTSHDPLGIIDVSSLKDAYFLRCKNEVHASIIGTFDSKLYLPYYYFRLDDYRKLITHR